MDNLKKILIPLLAVLLIGGGLWWWFGNDDSDSVSRTSPENGNQSQMASINELIARGQDLMCTYSTVDEQGNDNSGMVYFSAGRMSGDFTLTMPGQQPVNSHVINDGQYQYSWQEGDDQGYKLSLDKTNQQMADDSQDNSGDSVNQDQDFDFNCQNWNVDDNRFMPPSNVNFVDFTNEVQQAQENAAGALKEACSGLTGDARDACEASL